VVSKHLIFSNKVDLSQRTSVIIPRKKTSLKISYKIFGTYEHNKNQSCFTFLKNPLSTVKKVMKKQKGKAE